ncbi:MAG: Wzz/FepE/Etk N-terminal domain-containing protein, partial [Anaerovoracaceae bacterium]
MMEEKETTIELGAIFTLIKRNILLIIIVVLAFAILGFTASKCLMQEKYQAEATLIVNNIADTSKRVTNDEITSAKQLVNTYAVILTSDTVMDQVIDNLELRSIPKWKNITAKTLGTSVVKVSQVNETQAIKVTAITPDPDLSQDIVGEVVALAPETIIETVKAGSVETISGAKAQRTP